MPVGRDILPARYRAAVGVERSGQRQDGPACAPPSAGVAGSDGGQTIEFLRGDWDIERRIRDRRAGQDGVFSGRACFRATPDYQATDDGQVLEYSEDGELQFGGHSGPARRSLIYRGRADGVADVQFADGREFYQLDLRLGSWQADHPCRADRYHVTVTRLSPDSFTEIWQVAGPDKDYQLETTYRRVTAGGTGTGPEGCDAAVISTPGGPR